MECGFTNITLRDARGNLAHASNAVSRAFFEHDAFDNPIVVSDGWLSVTNTPDAFGRPLQIQHLDGLAETFSRDASGYDAYGRADSWSRTFQSAYSATELYSAGAASYDNYGNATNSILTFGAAQSPQTIANSYAYDAAGRLDSLSSTAGGVSVSREYDARGLLASESNNVVATSYAFDSLNRLTNITYRNSANGAQIASFGYTLDALGRVVQKTTTIGGQTSSDTYAYDTLGRLVAENGATFAYDLAGNRTSAGGTAYAYANNKLTGCSHDAAGNITHKGFMDYGWNDSGLLTSMGHMQIPSLRAKYEYDVLGRLASYTTVPDLPAAKTTLYVYDGDQIVADTDKNGNLLKTYVWGAGVDNLLAVTVHFGNAQNTYYPVKDHLGSTIALVDGNGAIAAQYTYDAWGKVLSKTAIPELSDFRYLWQCREYSGPDGLYYFRARWYDPVSGRFLSKDPIGLAGGMNLYAFCGNDPVNNIDPYGLLTWRQVGMFAKGVAVGAVVTVAAVAVVAAAPVVLAAAGASAATVAAVSMAANGVAVAAAVVGTAALSYDTGNAIYNEDWDRAAYNAGTLAGGYGAGKALGKFAVPKAPPAPKTPPAAAIAQAAQVTPKPPCPKTDPVKTFYHQGNLSNGKVSPHRALSTSENPNLQHYHPNESLQKFEVPESVYYRWDTEGLIFTPRDNLNGVSSLINEVRFLPPASGQMNNYLVK